MRNGSTFWAVVLIGAGILLLLNNLGLLSALRIDTWELIWPLFLIALGVRLISRVRAKPGDIEVEAAAIPLDGATSAAIELSHGAGELRLAAGAGMTDLVAGEFGGGLRHTATRRGDRLEVELKMRVEPVTVLNWSPGGYDWDVRLNPDIPLSLECETGASRSTLDLHGLRVTELKLETGASSTDVVLPAAAGYTRVKIEAGAARVDVRLPGGVAARIQTSAGLASIAVDSTRFPGEDKFFQSPDYESAENKVDIEVETGLGTVSIS